MANNAFSRGHTLNYKNTTGAVITSGTLILIGVVAAIAITDINPTETAACQIVGVHVLPAVAAATGAQGAPAYMTPGGAITGTSSGNTKVGVFIEELTAAQTTAVVKINV